MWNDPSDKKLYAVVERQSECDLGLGCTETNSLSKKWVTQTVSTLMFILYVSIVDTLFRNSSCYFCTWIKCGLNYIVIKFIFES